MEVPAAAAAAVVGIVVRKPLTLKSPSVLDLNPKTLHPKPKSAKPLKPEALSPAPQPLQPEKATEDGLLEVVRVTRGAVIGRPQNAIQGLRMTRTKVRN